MQSGFPRLTLFHYVFPFFVSDLLSIKNECSKRGESRKEVRNGKGDTKREKENKERKKGERKKHKDDPFL